MSNSKLSFTKDDYNISLVLITYKPTILNPSWSSIIDSPVMSVHTVWLTGGGANVQLLIGKSLSMKVVLLNYLNHNTPPIVDEKSFITVHKP